MINSEQYEVLAHQETQILKTPTGEIITMSYPPGFLARASVNYEFPTGEAVTVEGMKGIVNDEQWVRAVIKASKGAENPLP